MALFCGRGVTILLKFCPDRFTHGNTPPAAAPGGGFPSGVPGDRLLPPRAEPGDQGCSLGEPPREGIPPPVGWEPASSPAKSQEPPSPSPAQREEGILKGVDGEGGGGQALVPPSTGRPLRKAPGVTYLPLPGAVPPHRPNPALWERATHRRLCVGLRCPHASGHTKFTRFTSPHSTSP